MSHNEISPDPSAERMNETTREQVDEIIFETDKRFDEGLNSREEREEVLRQLYLAQMSTTDKDALEAIEDRKKHIQEFYAD